MKYLVNLDLNKNQLLNATVQNVATLPSTGLVAGWVVYYTGTGEDGIGVYVCDGAAWARVGDVIDSLNDIEDVTITDIASGEILKWNGTAWINNTLAEAGIAASSHNHAGVYEPANANIQTHIASTSNPHSVTASQVGLGNVNNTSDADKPVSTAQAAALALKAPLASPVFTGDPKAPTPTAGDNDTSIATTAFVTAAIAALVNGANASFDTLKEIQDAMATDAELAAAIAALVIGNGTLTVTAGTGLTGGGSFTANQTGNSAVTLNFDTSLLTGMAKKFAQTLSTSATSYVVTHNLASQDCVVSVREVASPYAEVACDVEYTSTNTVTLRFAVAPTANTYRVTVVG